MNAFDGRVGCNKNTRRENLTSNLRESELIVGHRLCGVIYRSYNGARGVLGIFFFSAQERMVRRGRANIWMMMELLWSN